MKTTRSWVGKKEPTNPNLKEAHIQRRLKRTLLREIQYEEWEQELNDFKKNKDANSTIQE
jgi:hypothetical protein